MYLKLTKEGFLNLWRKNEMRGDSFSDEALELIFDDMENEEYAPGDIATRYYEVYSMDLQEEIGYESVSELLDSEVYELLGVLPNGKLLFKDMKF